jgi:WD40 repeat protein
LLAAPTEQTLVCGTTNGWLIHIDLRTGRYEKMGAHSDCVNGACVVPNSQVIATGGDDKMVRLTDLRMAAAYQPVGAHQLRSVIFSLCADEEALYAGVEEGELKTFDFSATANPIRPRGQGQGGQGQGGFTPEQKAALAAAMATARNLRPPGAFR